MTMFGILYWICSLFPPPFVVDPVIMYKSYTICILGIMHACIFVLGFLNC